MKYFTQNWHNGTLPEAQVDAISQSYWQHIDEIASELPEQLFELATQINLHDGVVFRVILDHPKKTLFLVLRCGDSQTGYFDLALEYQNFLYPEKSKTTLEEAVSDLRNEVLYDEIDISDSGFIHRILFWPYREIDIHFSQFSFEKRQVENRVIPEIPDRFIEYLV